MLKVVDHLADTLGVMPGRTSLVLAIAVVLAACGTGDNGSLDRSASTAATSPTTADDNTATSPTSPPQSSTSPALDDGAVNDDVIEFVAAVDELLAETDYADAAVDDPDVFVATGWLLCDQLNDGLDPAEVLTVYVETLTGTDIDTADDDTLVLAGTLLGTAVGHLCPEHTETVEQSL